MKLFAQDHLTQLMTARLFILAFLPGKYCC